MHDHAQNSRRVSKYQSPTRVARRSRGLILNERGGRQLSNCSSSVLGELTTPQGWERLDVMYGREWGSYNLSLLALLPMASCQLHELVSWQTRVLLSNFLV